jgi:alkylation response protein AidB-like acyl-CoA dehydrogenase
MTGTLQAVHTNLGYLVVLVVLVAAAAAFRAPEQPPVTRLSSLTMVLLDVHVTIGIVLYVAGAYWEASDRLLAYAHPLLAVAALGVGHAGLARARRAGSSRVAATGLMGAFGLVVAAVAVASV